MPASHTAQWIAGQVAADSRLTSRGLGCPRVVPSLSGLGWFGNDIVDSVKDAGKTITGAVRVTYEQFEAEIARNKGIPEKYFKTYLQIYAKSFTGYGLIKGIDWVDDINNIADGLVAAGAAIAQGFRTDPLRTLEQLGKVYGPMLGALIIPGVGWAFVGAQLVYGLAKGEMSVLDAAAAVIGAAIPAAGPFIEAVKARNEGIKGMLLAGAVAALPAEFAPLIAIAQDPRGALTDAALSLLPVDLKGINVRALVDAARKGDLKDAALQQAMQLLPPEAAAAVAIARDPRGAITEYALARLPTEMIGPLRSAIAGDFSRTVITSALANAGKSAGLAAVSVAASEVVDRTAPYWSQWRSTAAQLVVAAEQANATVNAAKTVMATAQAKVDAAKALPDLVNQTVVNAAAAGAHGRGPAFFTTSVVNAAKAPAVATATAALTAAATTAAKAQTIADAGATTLLEHAKAATAQLDKERTDALLAEALARTQAATSADAAKAAADQVAAQARQQVEVAVLARANADTALQQTQTQLQAATAAAEAAKSQAAADVAKAKAEADAQKQQLQAAADQAKQAAAAAMEEARTQAAAQVAKAKADAEAVARQQVQAAVDQVQAAAQQAQARAASEAAARTAAEATAATAKAAQQQAEAARVAAEQARTTAEAARKVAEDQLAVQTAEARAQVATAIARADHAEALASDQQAKADALRRTADQARAEASDARALAQVQVATANAARQQAEAARSAAETALSTAQANQAAKSAGKGGWLEIYTQGRATLARLAKQQAAS